MTHLGFVLACIMWHMYPQPHMFERQMQVRRSDGSEASFAFVRQVDACCSLDMSSHALTMDVVEALVEICISAPISVL